MALTAQQCHAEVALRDGATLLVRPIRPADRHVLRAQFHNLRPASVRARFFVSKSDLTEDELTYLTEVDFDHHVALAAELRDGAPARPAGVGRFVRTEEPGHAEAAITVADDLHGKGIGSALLRELVRLARLLGIQYLDFRVLEQNDDMLRLLRHSGLSLRASSEDGIRTVILDLHGRGDGAAG